MTVSDVKFKTDKNINAQNPEKLQYEIRYCIVGANGRQNVNLHSFVGLYTTAELFNIKLNDQNDNFEPESWA